MKLQTAKCVKICKHANFSHNFWGRENYKAKM